jgi:hypothetical protein
LFLYGLFLIYPSVSSTVLRHFVCKQIDDRSYLWSDLRIQCYTDRWTTFAFVSFGLILLYPVGIPTFFFALLKIHQKDLNQPRIRAQLGFLYAGYRLEIWWWEIVDCAHKLALTCLIAFAPLEAQLPLGMVIATLFTAALLLFHPFLRTEDDLLQLFAQCEIYLLLLAGFVFYTSAVDSISTRDDLIMSVSLIALCVCFFAGFLFIVGTGLRTLIREYLDKRAVRKAKAEIKAAKQVARDAKQTDKLARMEEEAGMAGAAHEEEEEEQEPYDNGSIDHTGGASADEEPEEAREHEQTGSLSSKAARSGASNQSRASAVEASVSASPSASASVASDGFSEEEPSL